MPECHADRLILGQKRYWTGSNLGCVIRGIEGLSSWITLSKKSNQMERRKCQRFPVMLPAVFSGEQAGGGMVRDVSLEGCRIQSVVSMQRGAYVRMRIHLIGETLIGELAVVRWSTKDEFGVELIRMAPEQQDRLREFLNLFTHTRV